MRVRIIAAAALLLYLVGLLDLTLVRFPNPGAAWNAVPLRTIAADFRLGGPELMVNFFGNLGVTVPFGLLLPIVWVGRRPALRVALATLALSTAIELLQLASHRRVADVDDVILNVLGGMVGYLAFVALRPVLARGDAKARPWKARAAVAVLILVAGAAVAQWLIRLAGRVYG